MSDLLSIAPKTKDRDWKGTFAMVGKPLWLLAICLVGLFVRVYDLSIIEFREDEAFFALRAAETLEGQWSLVGLPFGASAEEAYGDRSVGYHGPLTHYLVAMAFYLFGTSPQVGAALFGILGALTIPVTFALGRMLWGDREGLIAATLTAFAPWFVLYSRMIWNPSLVPLLTALSLVLLVHSVTKERPTLYLLWGFIAGLNLQAHVITILLLLTGLLFQLLCGRKRAYSLLSLVGALLGYAPLVITYILNGFPSLGTLALQTGEERVGGGWAFRTVKALWNLQNAISGQGLWVSKLSTRPLLVTGEGAWVGLPDSPPFLPTWIEWGQGILLSLLFVISCAILIALLIHAWRGSSVATGWRRLTRVIESNKGDTLILLFVVVPSAWLILASTRVQRHYFVMLYSTSFLAIARGTCVIIDALRRARSSKPHKRWAQFTKAGLKGALALAVVFNLITLVFAYRFLVQTGGEATYGTVLQDKMDAVEYILEDSGGAFAVNLAGVHDRLPFEFLFKMSTESCWLDGATIAACSAQQRHTYSIFETPYVDIPPGLQSQIAFQKRGVSVVSDEQ